MRTGIEVRLMYASSRKAFALRLDPALYAAIERAAAADLRSANAQIEVLLREALARRGVSVKPPEPPNRGRPRREKPSSYTFSSTHPPVPPPTPKHTPPARPSREI